MEDVSPAGECTVAGEQRVASGGSVNRYFTELTAKAAGEGPLVRPAERHPFASAPREGVEVAAVVNAFVPVEVGANVTRTDKSPARENRTNEAQAKKTHSNADRSIAVTAAAVAAPPRPAAPADGDMRAGRLVNQIGPGEPAVRDTVAPDSFSIRTRPNPRHSNTTRPVQQVEKERFQDSQLTDPQVVDVQAPSGTFKSEQESAFAPQRRLLTPIQAQSSDDESDASLGLDSQSAARLPAAEVMRSLRSPVPPSRSEPQVGHRQALDTQDGDTQDGDTQLSSSQAGHSRLAPQPQRSHSQVTHSQVTESRLVDEQSPTGSFDSEQESALAPPRRLLTPIHVTPIRAQPPNDELDARIELDSQAAAESRSADNPAPTAPRSLMVASGPRAFASNVDSDVESVMETPAESRPAPQVSIEVSIGRLEVRAPEPPPAPRKPAAATPIARPSPAVSLDAILARRKGRRS